MAQIEEKNSHSLLVNEFSDSAAVPTALVKGQDRLVDVATRLEVRE